MKKIAFSVVLIIFSVSAMGQQILWSTLESGDYKYVPKEEVTKEVLELYELYKYYYDFTGYSKEEFIEFLGGSAGDWTFINELEERYVSAIRTPMDGGSMVTVMCIDGSNIQMIVFSNVIEPGFNLTYNGEIESDRKRFKKWFETL